MQEENKLPETDFKIPSWAGKPPVGTHLDVSKGDKLLQKLMIDEKRCYFFGRNPQACDIAVEHASCSRLHAALVYHKHLNRCFLIDLGSAHGTYISNVRLEPHKAEQLLPEQVFHFGASTRRYVLREKPTQPYYRSAEKTDQNPLEKSNSSFLGLPEKEEELENLTEYNTALNRRIASMTVPEEAFHAFSRKVRTGKIQFKEDEEIINPEDVDPNVGKFRNLVQTAVIANKRQKLENDHYNLAALNTPYLIPSSAVAHHPVSSHPSSTTPSLSSKVGVSMLNIAPEIELYPPNLPQPTIATKPKLDILAAGDQSLVEQVDEGPRKKKYAKEAWPGKKPGHNLLM